MDDIVKARLAATVVLYRPDQSSRCGFHVFMVRRSLKSRFMPGAYVFPGGAVDAADRGPVAALRVALDEQVVSQRFRQQLDVTTALALLHAGLRELAEETGLLLPNGQGITPFAHWITPRSEPRRFDTWFLAAPLPDGAVPSHDDHEVHDSRWVDPGRVIDDYGDGDILLAPPTFHTLWDLSRFGSLDRFLEDASQRAVYPVQPQMVRQDGRLCFLLPGDREGVLALAKRGKTVVTQAS